jgi:hypothetical protein
MTRATVLIVLEDAPSASDVSRLTEQTRAALAEAGFDVRFVVTASRSVIEDRARQVVADLDAAAVAYLQWRGPAGTVSV